ncbi:MULTISPECIES: CDP-glycerol glycerophosphotransferase family protein [unclassified Embleya]|uniref:bifunctional glycosyltransferase/CDP-glycerol:glycerophosphate glycerophosphotransferase n=1 Tax=unclassified Embleya TaxID=2699296 RepID=UPI0033DAAC5D
MSVVVIVYNDAERLPRAVRSVLAQTLNSLEVIIADDCSTDTTPDVARELEAADPRVRYVRLEHNSGGCSAPRNRGIEVSRAPYVMFLDSDDELPPHACKSLLLTLEKSGADFATGDVERYFEATGRTALWYPDLFLEEEVVHGLQEKPEMLFDHLSTNKMYRREFIEEHGLRFPVGIHYEDQLFSAQAFSLAKSFVVVPWVVYRWYLAAANEKLSISSSRHKMQNVVDRMTVARLVDEFFVQAGQSRALKTAKDHKFLRHDFRLYLGDLPHRPKEWVAGFAEATVPYLATLNDEAYALLPPDERICLYLLRAGRLEETVEQARILGRPKVAPRYVTRADDRAYWGRVVPETAEARENLDVTERHYENQVFETAILRHEVESFRTEGTALVLRLRTYDPGLLLGDEPVEARVNLGTTGRIMRTPFRLLPDGPGEFAGEVTLELADVPLGINGFVGRRHPTVTLRQGDLTNTNILLGQLGFTPLARRITYRRIERHSVRIECEPAGAGRFQITWDRTGAFKEVKRLGPIQRRIKRKVKAARKKLNSHENKATIYRALTRLPVRKGLVLFESVEGKGYLDNPRYIHEELVRQGRPVDVVWSYAGDTSTFPEGVKLVRRGSWQYVHTMARAQFWVDSHNLPSIYAKRPETHYLQTWHGQTMKTMGFDVPSLRNAADDAQSKHQAMVDRWDLLVSPSEEFERTFVPANKYTGDLLRTGYPRNDVLVRWEEPEQLERAQEARNRLGVPDGARVLLYAPTFRDGGRNTGSSIRVDLRELVDNLDDDWIIVVRAHYYDRFTVPAELAHVVRNGSNFPDVNDLLLASDALLTDYSSLMFDYANLRRPILLFVDDYENYKHGERGTYYDLEEIAPGPMLRETSELVDVLRDLDPVVEEYAERYEKFHTMFCSYETGHASRTVVDAFFGEEQQ